MVLKKYVADIASEAKAFQKEPKGTIFKWWNALKNAPFFSGPQHNDIGLSIGHKNIIAVELDKTQEIPRIVRLAVRDVTEANSHVPTILKELFQTEQFSNSFVTTALSGKTIIVRFIKFPRMQRKELRSALEFEAEKYIPFEASQVHLDFDILEDDEHKKYQEIALVAAKKDTVEEIVSQCKEASLTIKCIDIESFACLNTFFNSYPEEKNKTIALVNIGAKVTNLLIASQGMPQFSRDIYFGGDDITAGLSKKLHIDAVEAAKIKYNLKTINDENVRICIREVLGYVMTELRLSFDYFQHQAQQLHKEEKPLDAIYLVGGTSRLEGLCEMFESTLHAKVHLLDPLKGVLVDEQINQELLQRFVGSLAVPIGLALR